MKTTRHGFLKLLLILEGRGTIETLDTVLPCKSGDLAIVPAMTKHRLVDSTTSPLSLYGIGIEPKLLRSVPEISKLLTLEILDASRIKSLRSEHKLRRILYLIHRPDPGSRLASVATALELVAEAALLTKLDSPEESRSRRSKASDDPMLEAYLEWLHRNFFNETTLDGAATSVGVSRRTFTERFKLRTGKTWLEYVNDLRIRHAIDLLQQTDRKATSIAFQSGFDDLSTFYRVFTKVTGKKPSDYR